MKQSSEKAFLQAARSLGIRVVSGEPLAKHTSFSIGGPAALYAIPGNVQNMVSCLKNAALCGIDTVILGNGSNVLFADSGFDGLVISTDEVRDCMIDRNRITAGCGFSLQRLCRQAADLSLSGLAFAFGIPARIGGATVMNAGAFGGSLDQVVSSVLCYDKDKDCTVEYRPCDLQYGYRDSIFLHDPSLAVLETTFTLTEGDKTSILNEMNGYMARRTASQPLDYPSAGSVFKRPKDNFAGKLIEESGLKGYRIGSAEVSAKHAGFIINTGNATASDVRDLIRHVRKTVFDKTGVLLECEIRQIGFPEEL